MARTIEAGDINRDNLANAQAGQVLTWSATDGGATWQTPQGGPGSPAFPVGSVFIAVVNTNPATLLGYGTWSAIGAGRVLVGFDTNDTDFNAAEKTGGAKTVAAAGSNSSPTFTGNALAAHAHELPFQKVAGGTGVLRMLAASVFGTGTSRAAESVSAAPTSNATSAAVELSQAVSAGTPAGTVTAPTFTGSATSVVQPFLTVFIWKRTA